MIEENKEKYQEIVNMVNDGKYVEAKDTFEELLTNGITDKLKEKKNDILEKIKVGEITENEEEYELHESKKLTNEDLKEIEKKDRENRKKRGMNIPATYLLVKGENAIYGEMKDQKPPYLILIYRNGKFAY